MKLQYPFMQLPVSFDAAALAAEVGAIEESAWRPHPQGYPGNDALTLVTTGGDPDSDAVGGPMRPTPHLQRCPYLQQVLPSVGATWGRTRLMRLSGQAEVTPHVDVNYYWRERVRVHVPIVTQPTVRFTLRRRRRSTCAPASAGCSTPGACTTSSTITRCRESIWWPTPSAGSASGSSWPARARIPASARTGRRRSLRRDPSAQPSLDFESENVPEVMTPWEMRAHVAFALSEAVPHRNAPPIQQRLLMFVRDWHGLWSAYGERREGWPRYRALLDAARRDLPALGAGEVVLANTIGLMPALDAWVFSVALADRRSSADPEVRHASARNRRARRERCSAGRDPVFDRPVFIVSPPRSGSTMLFETLARAPGVFTIGDESHQLIEGVPQLSPESRGFESNRLLATDATPAMAETLRRRFYEALRDRESQRPPPGQPVRMLEKTPKNSLRVPFLARVFPEARFIYLYRDPRQVLSSMIEAWTTRAVSDLSATARLDRPAVVAAARARLARADRAAAARDRGGAMERSHAAAIGRSRDLAGERLTITRYDALVADPAAEIRRLCAATGLDWDEPHPHAALVEVHGVGARRRQMAAPRRRDRGCPAFARRADRPRRAFRGSLSRAKKSGGLLRDRRQFPIFRSLSEPDLTAQEDPAAQGVVGLRERVAVTRSTHGRGDRRILVEDVVDAQASPTTSRSQPSSPRGRSSCARRACSRCLRRSPARCSTPQRSNAR